jgi:hypothetical protein
VPLSRLSPPELASYIALSIYCIEYQVSLLHGCNDNKQRCRCSGSTAFVANADRL